MANIKSAKKRNRQNVVRRARNRILRTHIRNSVKELMASIDSSGNPEEIFKKVQSILSRAASKGIIHRKTASRRTGRLARRVSQAGTAS